MAVDPGSAELLLDPQAARLAHVTLVGGERPVAWMGSRVAGHDALVSRLGLGHIELHDVPASVTNLHRYSLEVNPEGEALGGVIGLSVLERFGVTIDFRDQVLELRPLGETPTAKAEIVPFERWGESELMVRGSLEGGRRMAFWLGTGLPEAAVGAPQATFDEAGVRAGKFANFVRGVGSMLSGTPWTQVMASTLAVGPVVRDHAEGWSGAMDPGEMWRHGMRRDGILGPRFFTGRRVTFDWARHELRFESR
jgi:hypothetical protein